MSILRKLNKLVKNETSKTSNSLKFFVKPQLSYTLAFKSQTLIIPSEWAKGIIVTLSDDEEGAAQNLQLQATTVGSDHLEAQFQELDKELNAPFPEDKSTTTEIAFASEPTPTPKASSANPSVDKGKRIATSKSERPAKKSKKTKESSAKEKTKKDVVKASANDIFALELPKWVFTLEGICSSWRSFFLKAERHIYREVLGETRLERRSNMRMLSRKNIEFLVLLKVIMRRNVLIMAFAFAFYWMQRAKRLRNTNRRWFSLLERIPTQIKNLSELVDVSDDDCKNVLRMDQLAFSRFCNILVSDGGLKNSKHVSAKEKVRSGQIISKYFHRVLHCVLKLHSTFLVEPQQVPDDSTDPRWGVNMDVGMEAEKGKVTRGRRSWTKVEEDALIQCLVGIVNDGWKADNGFKAGFQRELEKGMRKLIPGTDLVANPYINSKIHVWKKEYEICLIYWERVELDGIPQLALLTSWMSPCGMLRKG
ncbi:hypothetical protein ACS0TY_014426 [Phlomoides rotata]